MTVKELIEELSKYDPGLPVWMEYEYECSEWTKVTDWCEPKVVDLENKLVLSPGDA